MSSRYGDLLVEHLAYADDLGDAPGPNSGGLEGFDGVRAVAKMSVEKKPEDEEDFEKAWEVAFKRAERFK